MQHCRQPRTLQTAAKWEKRGKYIYDYSVWHVIPCRFPNKSLFKNSWDIFFFILWIFITEQTTKNITLFQKWIQAADQQQWEGSSFEEDNSYIYRDTNNDNEKIHSKQLVCFMLCHRYGVIPLHVHHVHTHSNCLSCWLGWSYFYSQILHAGQDLSHLMDLLNCFLKGRRNKFHWVCSFNMENSINKGIAPLSVKIDRSVPDRLATVIQFLIKINQLLSFLAPNYCNDICFKTHWWTTILIKKGQKVTTMKSNDKIYSLYINSMWCWSLTLTSVETSSKPPMTKSRGAITMRGRREYPITPRTCPKET